ncbi:MAG: LacI family transcriptional regulator [Rhizobiaceae bacterium]|nr:LacI family transcriptional regulator [Rhizobiaceae bacterium]
MTIKSVPMFPDPIIAHLTFGTVATFWVSDQKRAVALGRMSRGRAALAVQHLPGRVGQDNPHMRIGNVSMLLCQTLCGRFWLRHSWNYILTRADQKNSSSSPASATIKDVAREAGVGIGTVSRVVNSVEGVKAKTRHRVETAILRLGYNPNPIAQSMRNGLLKTFAYVARDFSVPILNMFVDAMQSVLDSKGFGLQVASSYHDGTREIAILKRLAMRRADGIVVATSAEDDPNLLKVLRELPIPVVLLDRDNPAELDSVLVDHRSGTRAGVQHLLAMGHRRVALISGQPNVRPAIERLAGFRDAFLHSGLTVPDEMIRLGSFSTEFAYSEAAMLFRLRERPTAVFAGGTAMLAGVIRAARDAALKIPEDLSVISGADSELAQLYQPGITTVRWQHDQLGVVAAKFLLRRLETGKLPRQSMIFPTELIQRGSCSPPHSASPDFAPSSF